LKGLCKNILPNKNRRKKYEKKTPADMVGRSIKIIREKFYFSHDRQNDQHFSGSCFWFHLDWVHLPFPSSGSSSSSSSRLPFFYYLFSYFPLIQSNEILGDVLLERYGGGKMFDALSGVWLLFNHRQISSHVLFISKKGEPEREREESPSTSDIFGSP
jgi:hypothetical protein